MIRKIKKRYRYKPQKPKPVKPIVCKWRYTPLGRLYVEVRA